MARHRLRHHAGVLPGAVVAVRVHRLRTVGLQLVAPPRGEAQLLAGARVLEDILGMRGTTPIDPRAAE